MMGKADKTNARRLTPRGNSSRSIQTIMMKKQNEYNSTVVVVVIVSSDRLVDLSLLAF